MKINRTGEIVISNEGYELKIIEYRNTLDIDVLIDNKYISKNCKYQNFCNGEIKNFYHKSIYNIGYIGIGNYKSGINKKHTFQYNTWRSMLQRCYDNKFHEKYPTYKDCTVCDEWHNFQNFAQWFDKNYYTIDDEKIELDKDILIKGNKIYSPDTCIFVPKKINNLFIKRQNNRGKYPIGVCLNKRVGKFIARIKKLNDSEFLGYFNTINKAFQIYKIEKERYIKRVADEYKNRIPKKLYEAMYDYKIEIDD